MLRILLVDDHAIVREGFKRVFTDADGFEVVAEAASSQAALEVARACRPDIAILDLNLGSGGNGLTLLADLLHTLPGIHCVLLSMHDDPGLVLRAFDLGASGYISKAVAPEELVDLVRRVATGEKVLSSELGGPGLAAPVIQLTARELDTLRGLLSDRPPKAVAADLGISDKTLYRHRANLMEKLGARTQGDLVRIARERALLMDLGIAKPPARQ